MAALLLGTIFFFLMMCTSIFLSKVVASDQVRGGMVFSAIISILCFLLCGFAFSILAFMPRGSL